MAVPEARMSTPHSSLYNTPNVSWIYWEVSTINPDIADLLCIGVLHCRQLFLGPSDICHPVQDNRMADYSYLLFYFPDTYFLAHMSAAYAHLLSL